MIGRLPWLVLTALCLLLPQQVREPAVGVHRLAAGASDQRDLEFLKTVLKDVRIVQLGENGHGAAEAMQQRARIARYLHEEMGFGVLAFESSLFLAHLADRRAAQATAQQTLVTGVLGVWHTAEVLPLFSHLRTARTSASPLRLAGFDVQPIGSRRRSRPAFFRDIVSVVDETYAQAVMAFDTEFFDVYDKGSAARRAYLRASGPALAAKYEALAGFLDQHLAAIQQKVGREDPLVARQEARSAAAYVRFQASSEMRSYAETRDHGMFENLRFLAEELYPEQKIIVWGHNYHLRHDNAAIPPVEPVFPGVAARSMGSWARGHFGRRLFTIGQYEFEGEAMDNARQPYRIEPAAPGSLEARLRKLTAGAAAMIVLAQQGWATSAHVARYNGQHEQTLVPAAQYDAVLFLPLVSRPSPLY